MAPYGVNASPWGKRPKEKTLPGCNGQGFNQGIGGL